MFRRPLAALSIGLPLATAAAAQAPLVPPAPHHIITAPRFKRVPDGAAFARFYPQRAQRAHVTGEVALQCAVTDDGGLVDCEVLAEDPANYGFGAAALAMTGLFVLEPKTLDGRPVSGGLFRTRIKFALSP